MLFTSLHRPCLTSAISKSSRLRHIFSLSGLTKAEQQTFMRWDSEKPVKHVSVPQPAGAPQCLRPQIYCSTSSSWVELENSFRQMLKRDHILKIATWNINQSSPGQGARAVAALEHLQALLGNIGSPSVIMLQEVCHESLQEILNSPWVQRNFVVSNVAPPESIYTDISGESFILRKLVWDTVPYCTLMMVSRGVPIRRCFRVPFVSGMGRDALVMDIPVSPTEEKDCLRLCTTHLESLYAPSTRASQLGFISRLLKGTPHMDSRIIAGVVGGDMNVSNKSEHEIHKTVDVDLNEIWEDVPAPPVPILKPFQKDLSCGRARGNTWGYQSEGKRSGKRLDKFFYTGLIETVAPDEAQDVTGRLGRFGMNLKTEVEAWEDEYDTLSFARGRYVEKKLKSYYSNKRAAELREKGLGEGLVHREGPLWVSDHFGLMTGIRVK